MAAALVIAPTLLRAQTSGDAPASPGLPPPVVRLSVGDSGVSIPDILPSGLVRLRLVSRGERARRVVLTRLRPGQEAVSYLSGAEGWLEGRSFGRWGEDPGSPGLVAPGDSTDVVVSLHPGRYVAAVWGETPGGAVRIDPSSRAIFEVLEPPPG
ncbi:MAG TPA: hypothetical protein VKA44_04625, partial [Gemmatimonadota bacterium]|nr:hypothetical protein [Gemmatimonadota bacterium]